MIAINSSRDFSSIPSLVVSGIMLVITPLFYKSRDLLLFHYTPKHASWMNQVEIWLSILVRKVIKRGNFTSVKELKRKVLAFIEYYNRTMAKPFKWTYQGKALTA